jgi:hypothetical protein
MHRADVLLQPFLTLELDEGDWSTLEPGQITPRNEPQYLLKTRLGKPQSKLDILEKTLLPTSQFKLFWQSSLQPNHYTKYATPAPQ